MATISRQDRLVGLARRIIVTASAVVWVMMVALATHAQTYSVLHNFTGGLDGASPYTGLTLGRSGNLYGTATYGGFLGNDCGLANGCGTVFELTRQGAGLIFRPLYQFQGFPSLSRDGANPMGRVTYVMSPYRN